MPPCKAPVYPRVSNHCGNRRCLTKQKHTTAPNFYQHKIAQTVQHGQEQKANVALYMPVLGHKQTQTCGMCFIDPRYSRRLQHQPQWDLKAKLCFFPGSQPKNWSNCWNTAFARNIDLRLSEHKSARDLDLTVHVNFAFEFLVPASSKLSDSSQWPDSCVSCSPLHTWLDCNKHFFVEVQGNN